MLRHVDWIRAVMRTLAATGIALGLVVAQPLAALSQNNSQRTVITSSDSSGVLTSLFTDGSGLDLSNAFFQPLGTNGRTCETCHVPTLAWTITPDYTQELFRKTAGLDPLFAPVGGTNSPNADISTLAAREAASSMMLRKALVRTGIAIPAGAQFALESVDDPYNYANAADLSLFRRPIPTTNMRFLTTVQWDGRESTAPNTFPISAALSDAQNFQNLEADLRHQAIDASKKLFQGTVQPSDDQLAQIVAQELSTATAQSEEQGVGSLTAGGALGGPANLANQPFYVTINDVLGGDHFGIPFNQNAMTLYNSWAHSPDPARRQIARGEALFNTKPIPITGVAGLNDVTGLSVIQGNCTTCHDAPNVGNHSVAAPLNIGISDASRRTPDLPLYTLRNLTTGDLVQTTDPGRALITGKWADIGKFKGPVLRALAGRAPYFHNGSAATLGDVVDFYDNRFGVGFTPQEKTDLVAFLHTL